MRVTDRRPAAGGKRAIGGDGKGGGVLKRLPRSRRRGLSIFEITLVIGIIVVVISGLITLFIGVQNNFRENRTAQLAQIIVSSVRSIYTNTNDYTGLTARMLLNTGDIPGWARQSAAEIETPESGAVILNGGDSWWAMAVNTERTGTCMAVLGAFLSEPEVELRISPSAVTAVTASTGVPVIAPPTPAAIETFCEAAAAPVPVLVFD